MIRYTKREQHSRKAGGRDETQDLGRGAGALILLAACLLVYHAASRNDAVTVEERERRLQEAMPDGSWTIVHETEVEGYLLSGARGGRGQSALAVFEPIGGGRYHLIVVIKVGLPVVVLLMVMRGY